MFFLLQIHHRIRLFDNFRDIQLLVVFGNLDHTAAEALRILVCLFALERILDPLQLILCSLQRAILKYNAELIATDPRKNVLFPDQIFHCVYKMADIPVALGMAEMIVDVFQMIEIAVAEHHTDFFFQHVLRLFEEKCAVSDPRHRIPLGFPAQHLLALFRLGHFADDMRIRLLALPGNGPRTDFIKAVLNQSLARAYDAYNLLNFTDFKGILDNMMLLGFPASQNRVTSKLDTEVNNE